MVQLRVGFLGDGHINDELRRAVEQAGAHRIVGTFGRHDELPDAAEVDVIVEAATQQAVRERVPGLIGSGIDVILLSVGALADPALRAALLQGGQPGRVLPCTGAIGGLDQVRALRAAGELTSVSIESRKLPATLIQPWMDEAQRDALHRGDREILLAAGAASEIAQRFPSSANVAASLALAADAWELATARVVADPAASQTRHEIHAVGTLGEVRCTVTNAPSPERPRSSAVVAWAALRALDDYAALRGFSASGVPFL